jgi:hypothetical protein
MLQPAFAQVTGKCFPFMNSGIGIPNNGRQRVHNVTGGIALPAEVPGQADLIHAPTIEVEWPQAFGNQHLRFHSAAGSGDHHPVEIVQPFLLRQFGRNLGEALRNVSRGQPVTRSTISGV